MRIAWLLAVFFVPLTPKTSTEMKKILIIPLLAMVPMLMSHTGMVQPYTPAAADTTRTAKDSTAKVNAADTAVALNDTLREVEINGSKELPVMDAIDKTIKSRPVQPGSKSISDIIGKKANDYIMHPFAWRERRKEKNLKKTQDNLKRIEAAKSYEDELTEAIARQLREDSIAEARKKQQAKERR